jgi:hypothetical protein
MLLIINIIFFIVFFALLAKAIFETVWGTCLIIYGIACHILAFFLDAMAMCVRCWGRITGKTKKTPRRQMSITECFIVTNDRNSAEAKRILASLR